MPALALQRCLHHGDREAIARCAECGSFFCRECITEHDERILCASCLAQLTRPAAGKKVRFRLATLRPWATACSGLIVAWLCFYFIGRMLVAIPSDFHASSIWKSGLLDPSQE